MCGEQQIEKCRNEHGEHLEWTCGQCLKKGKKVRAEDISDYTHYILWLRTLQHGGYPFQADTLPLSVWEDLGAANETIDSIREMQRMQLAARRGL